jgi:epoxide hydrolase-like predicted phosphatase
MSHIKAVYFDFGGVIVRTEDRTPRTQLAARLGLSYDQVAMAVFEGGADDSAARATLGQITEDEHWGNVLRALNLPESDLSQVRGAFFAGDRIDWNIVEFLRGLRKTTYRTGLISNAWSGLRAWIVGQGFEDAFDAMIISAEIAHGKPAPEIFLHALNQLGVQPDQAIFVDDVVANVDGSRALGMHGIQFRSAEQTLAEVNGLLGNGTN